MIRIILIVVLLAFSSCTVEVTGESFALPDGENPCIAGLCEIYYDGLVAERGEPILVDCAFVLDCMYITTVVFDDEAFELRRFDDGFICGFDDITDDYFEG